MSLREGSRVSYIGDGMGHDSGLELGAEGRVIAEGGTGSHILWMTGRLRGHITLTGDSDLSVRSSCRSDIEDSLLDGSLVSVAVRDTYDSAGAPGLINTLNDEGHLACFASIAEEAYGIISSRIRNDPSIRRVISELDDDEAEDFVAQATAVLIRDAFGDDDE